MVQSEAICYKVCAALLLRSPGLQFRAPVGVMEQMFSHHVPLPCAPFLDTPVGVKILILPGWLNWELQLQDCREFGAGHRDLCHPFEPSFAYLLLASLCLF